MTIAIFCLCYVGVLSYKVYRSVLQVERKSDKFNFLQHTRFSIPDKKAHESRERSSFLKKQGLLYTGALFIVWVFALQFWIVFYTKGPDYVAYLLLHIFYPAQGLFNFITYILPKDFRSKKKARLNLLRSKVIKNHTNHEENANMGEEVNSALNLFDDSNVSKTSKVKWIDQNDEEEKFEIERLSTQQNDEEKIEIEPLGTQEVSKGNDCYKNETTSYNFSTLHESSSHDHLDCTYVDEIDRK